MKKLILLLLFIPLVSFGQDDVTVVAVKSETKINTNIENELVLSDEKTTIKTPFTTDLSNYTHLLLVDAIINIPIYGSKYFTEYKYNVRDRARGHFALKQILSLSIFEVMNPYEVDKKRFKKEPNFLKTIKNESYLYLYLKQGSGRGDDINTTFVIRDWKNKTIYSSTHINTGLNEILNPLIN